MAFALSLLVPDLSSLWCPGRAAAPGGQLLPDCGVSWVTSHIFSVAAIGLGEDLAEPAMNLCSKDICGLTGLDISDRFPQFVLFHLVDSRQMCCSV